MENKMYIVTGGANGIGKALVEKLLEKNAKVAVLDIDKNPFEFNNNLLYVQGDLAEEQVLRHFVEQVVNKFGKVDCLVNNAMVSKRGILSDCSFEQFDYVLRIGVTAPYFLTKLCLPYFSDEASIINMSSTRATMSQADTESYSSAKGGISSLTHALSISLQGKVRVNSISPGWIHTGSTEELMLEDHIQHPVKRVGKVYDIIEMIFFLSSNKASFITGQDFVVDGGMSKNMIYHNDFNWYYSNK